MNDIVINKVQSIQRCIQRAREEHRLAGDAFGADHTRQDAAVLNITRACEQAIDLANYLIKAGQMGIPTSSAESFTLLAAKSVIPAALREKLKKMVGFRNIAIHQYQTLNIDIVQSIICNELDNLVQFTDCVVRYFNSGLIPFPPPLEGGG